MTCSEFRENVHALALGALDVREQQSCALHLASPGPHAGCHAELARARDAATLLALALPPVTPRPDLWNSIETAIARGGSASRAAPPVSEPAPREPAARELADGPARARAGRRWGIAREVTAWALAAAASVGFFFATTVERRAREQLTSAIDRSATLEQSGREAEQARQLCVRELQSVRDNTVVQNAAFSLIEDPKTQLVQLAAQGQVPYRASALLNAREKRAVVLASALTEQPGKSYELWVIRSGEKIPAGLLRGDAGGRTVAAIDEQILASGAPDALAVTLEPQGGSPQPTGPIVLLGAVPKI
jgi:hypothetical protein